MAFECKQAIASEEAEARAKHKARRRGERRCFWTRPFGHRWSPDIIGGRLQWEVHCRCCTKTKEVDWAW